MTLRVLANHRATLLQGPRFVGTGEQIADQMADWFNSRSCDGFVIAATHSRAHSKTSPDWWCRYYRTAG